VVLLEMVFAENIQDTNKGLLNKSMTVIKAATITEENCVVQKKLKVNSACITMSRIKVITMLVLVLIVTQQIKLVFTSF